MSELRETALVALDEREAMEIEGGARSLSPIIICELPIWPIPFPMPTQPLFGASLSA